MRKRQAEQKQEQKQENAKETKQVTKNEDNNKSPRNRPAGLQLPRGVDERTETIDRALDYCHHLRESGKVLDDENLNNKKAEIKSGKKLDAHMQELGLLLDAAEVPRPGALVLRERRGGPHSAQRQGLVEPGHPGWPLAESLKLTRLWAR